jgi:hypothetical protein
MYGLSNRAISKQVCASLSVISTNSSLKPSKFESDLLYKEFLTKAFNVLSLLRDASSLLSSTVLSNSSSLTMLSCSSSLTVDTLEVVLELVELNYYQIIVTTSTFDIKKKILLPVSGFCNN